MGGFINVNQLDDWEDAFGQPVTKGTKNALDLPAFHSFSEERYRYVENGARIQDPDTDTTTFTDQDEQFLIEPAAGDTIEFKTAESPRYIVGNDSAVSWSFQFTTGLQDASDSLTLFLADAFELEYTGDDAIIFRSIENGVTNKEKTVNVPVTTDSPTRPELTFNWYAVGRAEIEIDYTDSGVQKTSDPVSITVDDDWLSDSPAGRMGFRLDVANSGIQLEAGSMAYIPQTETNATGRPKPHLLSSEETNQIAADGYTTVAATRIDPDRDDVFVTLSDLTVISESSVDVELWATAVAPSDTDADFLDVDGDGTDEGPAYPRNNSPTNTVMQWTPTVSTFPTRTYPVTGSTIPTGRSVGVSFEGSAGVGSGSSKTGTSFTKPRPIYPDDVVLLIGHTPDVSTATDVDVFFSTDEDW